MFVFRCANCYENFRIAPENLASKPLSCQNCGKDFPCELLPDLAAIGIAYRNIINGLWNNDGNNWHISIQKRNEQPSDYLFRINKTKTGDYWRDNEPMAQGFSDKLSQEQN